MKTLIRDDEPFVMREEGDKEAGAREAHGMLPVTSYAGRDRVEIDAEALRDLIGTIRAKLLREK